MLSIIQHLLGPSIKQAACYISIALILCDARLSPKLGWSEKADNLLPYQTMFSKGPTLICRRNCGYGREQRRQTADISTPFLLYDLKQFCPGLKFTFPLGKWSQVSGITSPPSQIRLQSATVDQDCPFGGSKWSYHLPLLVTLVNQRALSWTAFLGNILDFTFLTSLLLPG